MIVYDFVVVEVSEGHGLSNVLLGCVSCSVQNSVPSNWLLLSTKVCSADKFPIESGSAPVRASGDWCSIL